MKKTWLLVLIFNALIFNAQESQEVTAAKWKEGLYDYYSKAWSGNAWDSKDEKAKLELRKTKSGKIYKIVAAGKYLSESFTDIDSASINFVRHYTGEGGDTYPELLHRLFIASNYMIVYKIIEQTPKLKIELVYCIGKKPEGDLKPEIIAYLEQTNAYYVPRNELKIADVESMKAIVISEVEELSSGSYIDIGLEVKMKGGAFVKTKNLGGNLSIKYLNIKVAQFEKFTSTATKSKFSWKINCSKLTNSEIDVELTSNYDAQTVIKTKTAVKCDTENSPVIKLSKIFDAYDEIRYSFVSNGKKEIRILKKLPETGYKTYVSNLLEIDRKKEVATDLIRVKSGNKIGYIDKTGKIILPADFEDGNVENFTAGLIGVKKGDKCGFMTLKNTIGVPFDYEMVWPYNGGIAKIKNDGKFGFVNLQGKLIAKPIYDEVWNLKNGAVVVKKDSKYGYINESGTVIVNTIYDDAFDFNQWNSGVVKLNGKYGCIDKTGKVIVPVEFEKSPNALNGDLFSVCKGGKFGIIKKDGKLLFDHKYDEIFNCGMSSSGGSDGESAKIIRVKKDGLFGFVKTDGKIIKECVYTSADDFFGPMAAVTKTENGVDKKGHLLINAYDGKGKLLPGAQEDLQDIEQPKEETTSSGYSGSKSSSKTSDKKTLKNTGKNPLYYRTSKGGAASRLNGGSSTQVPCRQDIYYCNDDGKGNHNVTGQLISGANQDCGGTVNAYGGN